MRKAVTAAVLLSFALLLTLAYFLRHRTTYPSEDPNASRSIPRIETRRVDGNQWIVSREDRDAYLKDLAGATKQITLKPNLAKEADAVVDLSVLKVTEESPMFAAGFRTDDRILKVNGTPIGTMQRAVNLVHEIRACDSLTVKVQRGDQIIDYRFDFK
jgi:membrane-associated protease RseP (regulator of RpoE activity)